MATNKSSITPTVLDANDKLVRDCALEAHKRVELMYRKGRTEVFKDERFIQFILYQVFCEKLGINSQEKKDRVVLEFPATLLQHFKQVGTPGKPRALDFAISPDDELIMDVVIPIAIEMKLAANCYNSTKMAAIQSDLIRLSFLRQRESIGVGPYARKCYFIMFGLKKVLDGLLLPGFPKGLNLVKKAENWWLIPIRQRCDRNLCFWIQSEQASWRDLTWWMRYAYVF